jgi:hypothetical protein
MSERELPWRAEPHKSFPADAAGVDPVATRSDAHNRFDASMMSFGELVAPRRWVRDVSGVRDRYLGDPVVARAAAREEVSNFSIGTWAMVVVAGLTLGIVLTLMAVGNS